ncbi:hypothetical protein IAI51_09960 [Pseudomonas sp. N40(2020)]|uniref:hypothetical protein n=1 Tax=Pseudomonas sp. N40(2020) TaxID=2767798 RepID=UPI0016572EAA|nr:hypothetical protein [Pseudomonas sp. N40(2020)]MBC8996848.1 hypothetical protein [Pseudomonas sp. N40(2020)]
MTTSTPPDNTVLVLYPPRAPEATNPVIGADRGVPKHVYDLLPMGLKIDVDPPAFGTVKGGDVIRLFLNGASTEATRTIPVGGENDVQTLYLPKDLLLEGRVNELVYNITRGSDNQGTSEPPLTLLYNNIRPGIEDRTPGDGAHSELELILPQDVLEDGIDADRAKLGVQVCFSYPYCRAHDVIRLNCNGKDVRRTVTAAEAPAIPSAEPTTVCVMVDEAVFVDAGDSPRFVFSYTVTDQLGNGPDTDSPYSGAVEVDVHLKETRLAAPDLAEDPDDPNDDPTTIDLEKLASKDLTVLVYTFAPQWQVNDKIRVSYTAKGPGDGEVLHTVEADVGRIPFTYKLLVPNAKVIAGSVVRAKYEQIRNGGVFATSKTTTADVTGGGTIVLLPPTLVSPAVNPIDPLAYPNGVTVRIEYLSALDGDRGRLVEVNPPAGSPQFPLVNFNQNKRINVVVPPAFLAARHGKEMPLRWNLNRNGGQAGKSPATELSVKKVANEDGRLPTPKILQAPDDKVLDLNTFEGDAEVTVLPWIGISTDNTVQLTLTGKDDNNEDHALPILTNHKITEEERVSGIKEVLYREKLFTFKNKTPIKVTFEVLPGRDSTSILFPTLTLDLLNAPQVITESFETAIAEWKNEGTVIDFPTMTVTVVKGPVALNANAPSEYTPFLTGNYFHLNIEETLRLTLKTPSKSFRFGFVTGIKTTALIQCYDEGLVPFKNQSTPSYDDVHQDWIDVTETVNKKIKYIDITIKGRATSRLDNFSMFY